METRPWIGDQPSRVELLRRSHRLFCRHPQFAAALGESVVQLQLTEHKPAFQAPQCQVAEVSICSSAYSCTPALELLESPADISLKWNRFGTSATRIRDGTRMRSCSQPGIARTRPGQPPPQRVSLSSTGTQLCTPSPHVSPASSYQLLKWPWLLLLADLDLPEWFWAKALDGLEPLHHKAHGWKLAAVESENCCHKLVVIMVTIEFCQ